MTSAKFSMDLSGRTLGGRYLLEARIGRGGFADVYRAVDTRVRKIVAVKVLHSDHTRNIKDVGRFINEAKIAGRIEHPHFVKVSDFFQDREHFCFVMEYLQGSTLRDVLRNLSGKPMSWPRAFKIALPICAGLAVAHSYNVVHRDIKPENIFLVRVRGGGKQVKLLDLGLAKVLRDHDWSEIQNGLSSTGDVIGSPLYIAPELVRGDRACTTRVDIYSLGIVLFEMVAGRVPFRGNSAYETAYHHVHTEPVRPTMLIPGLQVPTPLEDIILRAISKDPEDRFQTIRELSLAIRHELEHQNIEWRPVRPARIVPAVQEVKLTDEPGPTEPREELLSLPTGQSDPASGIGSDPIAPREPTTVEHVEGTAGPGGLPMPGSQRRRSPA